MVPCGFQFVHTMGHGFATSATLGNLPFSATTAHPDAENDETWRTTFRINYLRNSWKKINCTKKVKLLLRTNFNKLTFTAKAADFVIIS